MMVKIRPLSLECVPVNFGSQDFLIFQKKIKILNLEISKKIVSLLIIHSGIKIHSGKANQ